MRNLLSAIGLLFLFGCTLPQPPSNVVRQSDKFNGSVDDSINVVINTDVMMIISRFSATNGTGLFLNVRYRSFVGDGWAFINPGESLVFIIDGNRLALSGPGSISSRSVWSGSIVQELSPYPITRQQLQTISDGQNVEFKVYGSRHDLQGKLGKGNIESFRRFMRHLGRIDQNSAASSADTSSR